MALIMSTWAHGNAVVAEHPAGGALEDVDGRNYTAVVGYRTGGVAVYEGTGSVAPEHSDTWFHIPIPTISWLPRAGAVSGRAFLDSFCVLFRLENNCSVTGIQAWDGGHNRFFMAPVPNTIADQQMTGDWTAYGQVLDAAHASGRRTMTNLFTPRESNPAGGPEQRHAMLFGLGISVKVKFDGNGSPHPRIVFFGAGASWHDVPVG